MNFWKTLKKPILLQAPMEDITDTVFRQMLVKFGKPDVFFTEFTSIDGLLSKGADVVKQRLKFSEVEHPIIAQIWGNNPDKFAKVGKMLAEMRFDGIDINMGCPDRDVMKKGCGGSLIENHPLVKEIVETVKKASPHIPLSVKTRLGINTIQTGEWIGFLLSLGFDAICIHARTVKELSKVPAHWDEIGRAVHLRNGLKSKTLIIGNGDVTSYTDAMEKGIKFGVDGIMIGRAMFTNPWIFNPYRESSSIALKERLNLLYRHLLLFQETWGNTKYFGSLKKIYRMYITNSPDASEMRSALVRLKTIEETIGYVEKLQY